MTRISIIIALVLSGAAFPAAAKDRAPVATAALAPPPVQAAAPKPLVRKPQLHPELTLSRDLVSFGDLISGLPAQDAGTPAFRAPALGETSTIQVNRILEAARVAGLIQDAGDVDIQGLAQVVVTRAARRISALDIDAAVKIGLTERFGVDARPFAPTLDGGAPALSVEPELTGDVAIGDLSYDPRTRRVHGRVLVPGSNALRLKPVRITGHLVETTEVVVPRRTIARGETLTQADLVLERRPRDGQSVELIGDLRGAVDKVARRALIVGSPLRNGDVQREEIVARNELVTIVYEAPGLMITMRAKAGEAGAMGDVISVTNPQSKRTLQGTITGPGRVSVKPSSAGRVASAQ